MQGLGNTFVFFLGPYSPSTNEVIKHCETNHVDGLIVVTPLEKKLVRMKYWNSDGSSAEMCGNGLRCLTRFAVDNNLVNPGAFTVKTDAGKLKVSWNDKNANRIEVQVGRVKVDKKVIELYGYEFVTANVGNPHAITLVDNIELAPVKKIGPKVEHDTYFPKRTNVEFVEIDSPHDISMRIWERGVGETLACGTGMVSAAEACVNKRLATYPLDIHVPGGTARIWVDKAGFSVMRGPAEYID